MGIFDWADDSSDRSNIFTRMSGFSNHSSIQMIRINIKIPFILNLNSLVLIKSLNLLMKLIVTSSSGDIPAKIVKIAKEEIAEPIRNCINSSISTGTFPDE